MNTPADVLASIKTQRSRSHKWLADLAEMRTMITNNREKDPDAAEMLFILMDEQQKLIEQMFTAQSLMVAAIEDPNGFEDPVAMMEAAMEVVRRNLELLGPLVARSRQIAPRTGTRWIH